MHDRETLLWSIPYPWPARWFDARYRNRVDTRRYHQHHPLLSIWHHDPDDQYRCPIHDPPFTREQTLRLIAIATDPSFGIEHDLMHMPHDDRYHLVLRIAYATRRLLHAVPWWRTAFVHVWHWRIVVHPWCAFKRWLFCRCAVCGQRLGDGRIIGTYTATGHQYYHDRCLWVRQYERSA